MPCRQSSSARAFAIFIAIMAAISVSSASAEAGKSCALADPAAAPAQRLEGKRFSVEIRGQGADVILIPGLSTPRAVWAGTVSAFAGCYRLHVVQVRGFGDDAGVNAQGPVLEPLVTELADYIDDEIVGRGRTAPAIVGHSMGGLAALMIGARAPQLAEKLMVVDALPFIGTIFGAANVDAVRPRAEAIAESIRSGYRADAPAPALLDCDDPAVAATVTSIWSNSARGRCIVANWGAQSDPRVIAQVMLDDTLTDKRPDLPKIIAPLTVLYAQDDAVMPEATMRAIYESQYAGTPKFTGIMVKSSFHFIMLDQPEKFRDALAVFLINRDSP